MGTRKYSSMYFRCSYGGYSGRAHKRTYKCLCIVSLIFPTLTITCKLCRMQRFPIPITTSCIKHPTQDAVIPKILPQGYLPSRSSRFVFGCVPSLCLGSGCCGVRWRSVLPLAKPALRAALRIPHARKRQRLWRWHRPTLPYQRALSHILVSVCAV